MNYDPKEMNSNGDKVDNIGCVIPGAEIFIGNVRVDIWKNKSFEVINEFIDWCKQNNIKIVVVFPAIAEREEYSQKEYLDFFENIRRF